MVSIITVNFNQTELTCALLDSIRAQDYTDVEVIVVDNGSEPDPGPVFQAQYPEVQYLRSTQNLGFAGGNNLALPTAKGDYLFFVNNDAEISTGCIQQLVQLLQDTPQVGIVSPLICYTVDGGRTTVDGLRTTVDGGRPTVDGYAHSGQVATLITQDAAHSGPSTVHRSPSTVGRPPSTVYRSPSTVGRPPSTVYRKPSTVIQYAGMPRVNPLTSRSNMDGNGELDRGQYAAPFTTGYAHGAAMMVPRKVLEQVGPMSEDYFLYYEEVDWCERMYRAGYSVWVEPRALVWHKESMTMQGLGTTKTYFLARNRILFMRRHYGGWRFGVFALFMTFVSIPKQLFSLLAQGAWSNLRAFWAGVWWNVYPSTERR